MPLPHPSFAPQPPFPAGRGPPHLARCLVADARPREAWPTRAVKVVVPFAAGGTTNLLARIVAARMSEEFGQQFVVENKVGAGGNIAADFVAKAEPDGYTFVVGTPGPMPSTSSCSRT